MNPEAISGKTGYTGKAGYCYVGAVESEGRTFVVALLACGWPNHKNYKWQDMKEVIEYATENYQLRELKTDLFFESVSVNKAAEGELFQENKINVRLLAPKKSVLLEKEEEIELRVQQMKELEAPVKEGEQLGSVLYTLHGETIAEYPIVSVESVKRIDFFWIFSKIMELYLK
jgi:D-alanyl-D-alanine carboxypeptidase (penicillin-binding protein 5/6)